MAFGWKRLEDYVKFGIQKEVIHLRFQRLLWEAEEKGMEMKTKQEENLFVQGHWLRGDLKNEDGPHR